MNKVSIRCMKDSSAKFLFASKKMYSDLKWLKIFMYLLNVVPVVICFLPQSNDLVSLICSFVSFGLTLFNEFFSAFISNYKEKAILSHQIYESEITGSTFSKIEYDRETTNDLNELAIRKGLPKMKKASTYPISHVPQDISDDYSYLYLCRVSAAKYRYLLERIFYIYFILLIGVACVFSFTQFIEQFRDKTLYFIICFWPLIIPFIRDCAACKKCMRQCVKICADIDNFFADGDSSIERLARFYYYTQNLEFEMLTTRPVIFKLFELIFSKKLKTLSDGVTDRFKDAIYELRSKSLINKGIIQAPKGKSLITRTDIDIDKLTEKKKTSKKTIAKSNSSIPKKSSTSTKTATKAKATTKKITK